MSGMTHGSLFSGIGGFDLAAEWMGWENVFHCEWNEFGQKILKHYWPNATSYTDITKTDFTVHRGAIDVLTGGFPCQPYSLAGKRLGKEDDRHLWPEMLRAIREIQPTWVVGENVFGLINWNGGLVFHEVQADLEAEGYEVQPYVLPACAVNAPHRRDRVWFVAYSKSNRDRQERICNRLQGNECDSCERERVGNKCSHCCQDVATAHIYHNGQHGTQDRQSHPEGNDGDKARANTVEQSQGCGSEATRIIADPTGKGLALTRQAGKREFQQEDGEGVVNRSQQFGATTTNTNGIGLRGEGYGTGESGQPNKESPGNYWQDFPTQPPVCSGDDGLPTGLDGITFSKWRNESIKAGGNAIVPQVAYQIFKAINQLSQAS
ncbi:DNA cytosine methyltransferase [Rufibacter roseus]|nr:DNA (cytosine-5-)-methyltransferase [Rufibacter roseus]